MITGYNDNFNRTVASGFGTATSGQVYTVAGTASQYNVVPSEARILPTATGERFGWVDRQTSDIDITGQVALTAIPATNLMTVGFVIKRTVAGNDYYNATMMVAAGGAVSLRFSKVVGGALSTITTVATGITYVANTFYNLRVTIFWSDALQTNVLRSKLWAIGATEPGGWQVSTTDNSHTKYTAGTQAGPFARDEATVVGAVTAKIQNVVARSYGLPVPAGTDTMCADPAVAYPKQTALESLADAVDPIVAVLDQSAALAALFPRVRVSLANVSFTFSQLSMSFTSTEFNIGTSTNLAFDPTAIYLPVGVWLVMLEAQMVEASVSDFGQLVLNGASPNNAFTHMRFNEVELNSDGVGGTGHVSCLVNSTDPAGTIKMTAQLVQNNGAPTYTVRYAALSAIKISDYFA